MQRRILLLLVGVCLTSWTLAAPADDLSAGLRLYEQLEYRQARPLLEQALAAETLPEPERARAAFSLGVIELSNGDEPAARQRFGRALELDCDLPLPPDSSPKIVKLFEAMRAELPALETAEPPVQSPTAADTDPTTSTPAPSTTSDPAQATGQAAAGGSQGAGTDPTEALAVDEEAPLYTQWWLWAGVGAVAVTAVGVTALAICLSSSDCLQGGGPGPDPEPDKCEAPAGSGCVRVHF